MGYHIVKYLAQFLTLSICQKMLPITLIIPGTQGLLFSEFPFTLNPSYSLPCKPNFAF